MQWLKLRRLWDDLGTFFVGELAVRLKDILVETIVYAAVFAPCFFVVQWLLLSNPDDGAIIFALKQTLRVTVLASVFNAVMFFFRRGNS